MAETERFDGVLVVGAGLAGAAAALLADVAGNCFMVSIG